jgi:arsenite oxidase large subunit
MRGDAACATRAGSARIPFRSPYPTGTMGNVASKGVNELIIPNYKQTWANIRKIADAPEVTRRLTFKSQEYVSG